MSEMGEIQVITSPITRAEAHRIGKPWYTEMVKGVVDIDKGIVALGGEYHMDANMVLIGQGSDQSMVWGFNIYPERTDEDWIEYRSLINIRPVAGNKSMIVEDTDIQNKMRSHIERLIV